MRFILSACCFSQIALSSVKAAMPEHANVQDVVALISNHIDLIKSVDIVCDMTVIPRIGGREYNRCRLVENVETGRYRFDLVNYNDPDRKVATHYIVFFWDGKRQLTWDRVVTAKPKGIFPNESECVPGDVTISSEKDPSPRLASLFLNPLYQESIVSYLRKESLKSDFHIEKSKMGSSIVIGSDNIKLTIDPSSLRIGEMAFGTNVADNRKYTMEEVHLDDYAIFNGIDFPCQIDFVSDFGNGRRIEKLLLNKDLLRINGDIKSVLEHLDLPPGCIVSDQIENRRYQIYNPEQTGTAGKGLRQEIDQIILDSEKQKQNR